MNIKSLLLGSAASLVAVSGAQAADAVVVEPEPAEYVRVCDAYGSGFFYLPGTETCMKFSGYVRTFHSNTESNLDFSGRRLDPSDEAIASEKAAAAAKVADENLQAAVSDVSVQQSLSSSREKAAGTSFGTFVEGTNGNLERAEAAAAAAQQAVNDEDNDENQAALRAANDEVVRVRAIDTAAGNFNDAATVYRNAENREGANDAFKRALQTTKDAVNEARRLRDQAKEAAEAEDAGEVQQNALAIAERDLKDKQAVAANAETYDLAIRKGEEAQANAAKKLVESSDAALQAQQGAATAKEAAVASPTKSVKFKSRLRKAHSSWKTRARFNIDTRNETEWGTLRSYVRLQSSSATDDGKKSDLEIDQALISVAGFRAGIGPSLFNANYGVVNLEGVAGEDFSYGYSNAHVVDYTFSVDNLSIALGAEVADGADSSEPSFLANILYSSEFGDIGYVGEMENDEDVAHKVYGHVDLSEMLPGGKLGGWYMWEDLDKKGNSTRVGADSIWGAGFQMDLSDHLQFAVLHTQETGARQTHEGSFETGSGSADGSYASVMDRTGTTIGLNWYPIDGLKVFSSYTFVDGDGTADFSDKDGAKLNEGSVDASEDGNVFVIGLRRSF